MFGEITGSPYYRLLEKYFVQEIIFRSFTYHCVVLLSSFRLHSQPIRVILREIKILKGAQGNKGAKSKGKSEEKENEQGLQLS